MARLLVEIDEELKRELKIRLLREGITLKTWLTRSARAYVAGMTPQPASASRPAARAKTPAPAAAPPAAKKFEFFD